VPSFSHSKLTTYQQCPQKYKFRYVDEIPPPVRSIELHLGDTVHQALEKLYADALLGKPHSSDELLAFYQEKWAEGYAPQMRIVRSGTNARTYLELGRQMLMAYHKRFYPFNESTTLELEEKFSFPLYELALRQRWPDARRITLIWHYLTFDQAITIAKTLRQLEMVKQKALDLISRIEATTVFPTEVTPLCDWCEYKEMCPAMKKC